MHHQILLNLAVKPVIVKQGIIAGVVRYAATFEDNTVIYDVFPDYIKVLHDIDGSYEDVYLSDEIYDNLDVSQVIAYILNLHLKRRLKRGVTVDTVMVYTNNNNSRFTVSVVGNKPTFHDKEGLVFQCLEGDCYQAVPTEVVCGMIVSRMGLSIKLFDPSYLVRFKVNGLIVYAPLSAVYQDPVIRDLEHWNVCRHVVGEQWDTLQTDLLQLVDDYTAGN